MLSHRQRIGISAASPRTALTLAPLAHRGSLGRRAGAAIVVAYAAAAAVVPAGA